jgi:isoleucyl-tRNA synthetase
LHQITHAMLRWMAPFLSFTAEEAWRVFGTSESIFLETFSAMGEVNTALVEKWAQIQQVRELANKEIETQRSAGLIGASLQAELTVHCDGALHDTLASLGEDLKFVFITSHVRLVQGPLQVEVQVSTATKCERCWHYSDDVGADAAHPSLCGRCVSNLHGAGEVRHCA